jgi:hypothetical protein
MNSTLQLRHEPGRHVDIATAGGASLWRYVYAPLTPPEESPRPYVHPLYSLAGDMLTNFRPNDHPWHHGLSLTLTSVDGVNFWGGPTYRAGDGYRWRDDHGVQVHRAWSDLAAERLEQEVDWLGRGEGVSPRPDAGATGERGETRPAAPLLHERRVLQTSVGDAAWTLRWTSELRNVSGRVLRLGNYHASAGLAGSHYTGLQFRGARDLLDEHGDEAIGIRAEGGLSGEAAVHGASASWMEWACRHDGSLRRTRIRFENAGGPIPWFVRAKNPLAAFAFQREAPHILAAGATLRLDHRLTFAHA